MPFGFGDCGRIRNSALTLIVLATVLALAGLTSSAVASFAPDTVMTFQIVRNSDPACEPTCPEWIYAAGSIEPFSPSALRKLLKALGPHRLPIVIASNGGDRPAALEIGRIIRKHGLTVAIGLTTTEPCVQKRSACQKQQFVKGTATFQQANCISACPFLFAGGVVRLNNENNVVGLHIGSVVTYTNGDKSFKELKQKKRVSKILRAAHAEKLKYLSEMGIKPEMEDKAFSHEQVYEVPFTVQQYWNLVTGSIDTSNFTRPDICLTLPLPDNCIKRELSAVVVEKFPASWRKTMTNDPATNFYLSKYTVDLDKPLQTVARNFIIARVVGSFCLDAKIEKAKLMSYVADAGMDGASLDVRRAAYDVARMTFNGFDYRALAHLCAGVDFMFGPNGKLAQNIGEPGKGEPRDAYDPMHPYFMVESLVPRP